MIAKDTSIVCIGNRFLESDNVGPRVYDCLAQRGLPGDVSLIDGGLMGLDLLQFVEAARRVIFVDTLEGFAPPGSPVILDHGTAMEERHTGYGHGGGLAYLLRMLPAVCGNHLPDIAVVGTASPAGVDVVGQLADIALGIATGEKYERGCNTAVEPALPGAP